MRRIRPRPWGYAASSRGGFRRSGQESIKAFLYTSEAEMALAVAQCYRGEVCNRVLTVQESPCLGGANFKGPMATVRARASWAVWARTSDARERGWESGSGFQRYFNEEQDGRKYPLGPF